MKKLFSFPAIQVMAIALVTLALLGGCASLGVATPQTFNEKVAAALTTVTSTRTLSTTLLDASKITTQDAQNVQEQANNFRAAIDVARQIHDKTPDAADQRLQAALVGLDSLIKYLEARKK